MGKNYDNDVVQAIAKSIASALDMSRLTYDYVGYISGVDLSKNNTYKVKINKAEYSIKNGTGITFNPGDRCLVYCISGNFNNKVIIAKL